MKITLFKRIKISDLNFISKLLETSLSINDCLNLIKNKENAKIIEEVITQLDKGVLIENCLSKYLPSKVQVFFKPMMSKLSFKDALKISLKFNEIDSRIKEKIIKEITYPFILVLLSIVGLYFFDLFGLDTIISMLDGLKVDTSLVISVRVIFKLLLKIIYILIIFILLVVLLVSRKNNILIFYSFICEKFRNNIMQIYYCSELMNLYNACYIMGFKTKEILEILKLVKNKPVICYLANNLENSLLKGESIEKGFKEFYFDDTLNSFIKIASYTNSFSELIGEYISIMNKKIEERLNKFTMTVQCLIYLVIGMIIVFIYQLLFMPMQAISDF